MSFNYLTESNIKQAWEDSRQYMKPFFDPLAEYERIARNRPHPKIDAAYPKNTDGTLAAIIQELPKRIVQQEPTGTVKSNDPRKWLPIVTEFVLVDQIIPRANCQATPIQKSWAMISKAKTFGAQHTLVYFGAVTDGYGADFKLPYVKDVYYEKGKLTRNDCNLMFLRSWYQQSDLEAIISKEDNLEKEAKKRKEKYNEGWNRQILRDALKQSRDKTTDEKSNGENDRNAETGGIEIIHAFQKGEGSKFYAYLPSIDKICRTKVNPDPRGEIPIVTLYDNVDLENPLGRGAVELSGGMQNFIDSSLQMYQYMMGLMANPPLRMKGSGIVKQSIKYKNGALWNLGSNPDASIEPVNINTIALSNFGDIYGLSKSQILNLNNSTDTSISSDVGNPGFSKTPAGVNALEAKLGISDNQTRKSFESAWSNIMETCINIQFAEKSGMEEIQLDKETAEKLRALDDEQSIQYVVGHLSDDDVWTMDYDDVQDVKFHFEVDASTSKMKNDASQLEALDGLLERAANPILGGVLTPDKIAGIYNAIVSSSGVENPEKLAVDIDELQAKIQEQEQMAQEQQMTQGEAPEEQMQDVGPEMMPEGMEEPMMEEPVEPQLEEIAQDDLTDDEIVEFVEGLRERGFPDDVIETATTMLEQGMSEEEVVGALEQFLNQGGN